MTYSRDHHCRDIGGWRTPLKLPKKTKNWKTMMIKGVGVWKQHGLQSKLSKSVKKFVQPVLIK